MAAIYIHIPFCKKACHYCNFHFSTTTHYKDELIAAMLQEIELQKNYLLTPIETIYFGGGTPSILSVLELGSILQCLQKHFTLIPNIEITLEANPDDINETAVQQWHSLGINRLSIGIQSFVEADLIWMNRAHNVHQAIQSIKLAKQYGINNISIDLIYGTPNLTNQQWLTNIETAINLGIQHLSCYALTVEPNTALHTMIGNQKVAPLDENKAAEQFEILMQYAATNGLEHYEISNFATAGYRSKHNSSYWHGVPYLGIGPSAHSYNGISRQWNVANNNLYTKALQAKQLPYEIEILTPTQIANEYIMTALRLKEGLHLSTLCYKFNTSSTTEKSSDAIENFVVAKAQKYIDAKLVLHINGYLLLTNVGKLRADGIASDLFF